MLKKRWFSFVMAALVAFLFLSTSSVDAFADETGDLGGIVIEDDFVELGEKFVLGEYSYADVQAYSDSSMTDGLFGKDVCFDVENPSEIRISTYLSWVDANGNADPYFTLDEQEEAAESHIAELFIGPADTHNTHSGPDVISDSVYINVAYEIPYVLSLSSYVSSRERFMNGIGSADGVNYG